MLLVPANCSFTVPHSHSRGILVFSVHVFSYSLYLQLRPLNEKVYKVGEETNQTQEKESNRWQRRWCYGGFLNLFFVHQINEDVGHEKDGYVYEMLVGNCNRRDCVGDRGLVGRMILKLIQRKFDERLLNGFIWSSGCRYGHQYFDSCCPD